MKYLKIVKDFFSNTSIVVIVLLIIFFVLLAVYLYNKAHERQLDFRSPSQQQEDWEKGFDDLEKMKEEMDYVSPSDEEIERQISELDELRKGSE